MDHSTERVRKWRKKKSFNTGLLGPLYISLETREKLEDLADVGEIRPYAEKLLEKAIAEEWQKLPNALVGAVRQLRLLKQEIKRSKE